jgi:hypothetical protein
VAAISQRRSKVGQREVRRRALLTRLHRERQLILQTADRARGAAGALALANLEPAGQPREREVRNVAEAGEGEPLGWGRLLSMGEQASAGPGWPLGWAVGCRGAPAVGMLASPGSGTFEAGCADDSRVCRVDRHGDEFVGLGWYVVQWEVRS